MKDSILRRYAEKPETSSLVVNKIFKLTVIRMIPLQFLNKDLPKEKLVKGI
jgi:hypothetical protein